MLQKQFSNCRALLVTFRFFSNTKFIEIYLQFIEIVSIYIERKDLRMYVFSYIKSVPFLNF